MAERRVAQIVAESNGFGQIFIQSQSPRQGARDLGDFQGMGQAGPIMIAFRRQENLGLVLQTPESFAVQDPVPIDLKSGPDRAGWLTPPSAARRAAQGGSVPEN